MAEEFPASVRQLRRLRERGLEPGGVPGHAGQRAEPRRAQRGIGVALEQRPERRVRGEPGVGRRREPVAQGDARPVHDLARTHGAQAPEPPGESAGCLGQRREGHGISPRERERRTRARMLTCRPPAMSPTPTLAWLFDIDGTLLSTEGAAREAFARAARERLGVDDTLGSIAFAGRTEPHILADILAKHGRTLDTADEARFWDAVFTHIRALLVPPRGRLLAGVPRVLDAVADEPGWRMAVLTGNMTEMARIKLARFGIEGRFAFSACGEEAVDRDALARLAVERARQRWGLPPSRCVVVGDTEHDIRCARAAGARVVAVATGSLTRPRLAEHAPDLVLDDLSDAGGLMAWARALPARGDPEATVG